LGPDRDSHGSRVEVPSRHDGIWARYADQRVDKLLKSAVGGICEGKSAAARINAIDVDEYYGEEAMWARLESLAQLIREKLRALGRREAK